MTVTGSDNRLLRLSEVQTRCGLSRSTLYRQMGEGAFPRPLRVGVRAVRWRESEIEDWLSSRPRAAGYPCDSALRERP